MGAVLCAVLAVAAGGADDKKPDRDDAPRKAFVELAAKNGIKLEQGERGWVVVDPKAEGLEVVVYFRTFPPAATEKEMRDELKTVNIAMMLNVPARLAMSHPGVRRSDPAKKTPPELVEAQTKLEKLFKEFAPGEKK